MALVVMLDRSALPADHQIPLIGESHRWQEYANTSAQQAAERLQGATVAVLSKVPIAADTLDQCPELRHIAVAATGVNTVDLDACKARGISVSNIPSYAANTVAEHVIGSSLLLRRQMQHYRQLVQQNAWQSSPGFCLFDRPFSDIAGATIGLVGLGEIGKATASKAIALGMRVIFSARRPMDFSGATQVPLEQLLADADVISLHCSLNDSTRGLIGATELASMRTDAILINTARGGIVDEKALVTAIEDEVIGGAAFDVLAEEPPADDSPLLSIAGRTNVLITPHISWTSEQAVHALSKTLIMNIETFLADAPQNLV